MTRALGAALLLAAGAAGAIEIPTGGTPARVNLTNTTIVGWHGSNADRSGCDDYYWEGIERFNVNASWEGWVAGLRLDAERYLSRPEPTPFGVLPRCDRVEVYDVYGVPNRYLNRPRNAGELFERAWVGWSGKNLEVTLGDTPVQFGRGLVLSLRKVDEFGLDTTQRGLRVRWFNDAVSATLVGGLTNINNLDEASARQADEPYDAVIGATADVQIVDGVRIGASAAGIGFNTNYGVSDEISYRRRWLTYGPRIDAARITPWLGFYLEGIAQRRVNLDGRNETGFGAYGSATVYAGAVTLLFEGKAYGDLEVTQPDWDQANLQEFTPLQYTSMPTVERVQQELEHKQRRVSGGRLRADWSLAPGVGVYGNVGVFRDWQQYPMPDPYSPTEGTIVDPYAGLDGTFGAQRVTALAGVRFVNARSLTIRRDGHLDVNVARALGGGRSAELHVVHLERMEVLPFATTSWREGTLTLSWRDRPKYALSAALDYSTEPDNDDRTLYPGGIAEWDFTEASILRVFAGMQRGGLKCVAGVCRIFPPFAGVKATLTLRY